MHAMKVMDYELGSRKGFEKNKFSLVSWLVMFLTQIFTQTQKHINCFKSAAYFKVPHITTKTKCTPSSSSQLCSAGN